MDRSTLKAHKRLLRDQRAIAEAEYEKAEGASGARGVATGGWITDRSMWKAKRRQIKEQRRLVKEALADLELGLRSGSEVQRAAPTSTPYVEGTVEDFVEARKEGRRAESDAYLRQALAEFRQLVSSDPDRAWQCHQQVLRYREASQVEGWGQVSTDCYYDILERFEAIFQDEDPSSLERFRTASMNQGPTKRWWHRS